MDYRYSIEVLHVKSLSPLVNDDDIYILHLVLMCYGLWVCGAIERGMKGLHYEFQGE